MIGWWLNRVWVLRPPKRLRSTSRRLTRTSWNSSGKATSRTRTSSIWPSARSEVTVLGSSTVLSSIFYIFRGSVRSDRSQMDRSAHFTPVDTIVLFVYHFDWYVVPASDGYPTDYEHMLVHGWCVRATSYRYWWVRCVKYLPGAVLSYSAWCSAVMPESDVTVVSCWLYHWCWWSCWSHGKAFPS